MRFMVIVFAIALGQLCAAGSSDRIRQLEDKFVSPCCWRESLATHGSPEAQRMRVQVAERIEQGWTDQQIVDSFVARLGERILREPTGMKQRWLYMLPSLALLGGLIALLQFLRLSLKRARRAEMEAI